MELYNHVFEYENEHFHLLPRILSPHTSYPLIAMFRSCMKHRLTPLTFLLCIRRKLRLPIYPNPNRTPCTCGHHEHDITETKPSAVKEVAKNEHITSLLWILPELYLLLLHKPATLFILTHPWQLAVEPLFHLCSDSTARPFNISISPDPTACRYCPYTTIGADINIRAPAYRTPKTYQPDLEYLEYHYVSTLLYVIGDRQ